MKTKSLLKIAAGIALSILFLADTKMQAQTPGIKIIDAGDSSSSSNCSLPANIDFYVNGAFLSTNSTTVTITYFFGDGTSAQKTAYNYLDGFYGWIQHTYTAAGSYTTKYIATSSNGYVDSLTVVNDIVISGNCSNITGTVYVDNNNNCIYDAGDAPKTYQWLKVTDSNGTASWASTGANGTYSAEVPTGYVYAVAIYQPSSTPSCPALGVASVDATNAGTYTQNFAIRTPTVSGCHLYANASGYNPSSSSSCDGYASTYISGGTSPYTYEWSMGSTGVIAAKPVVSGLCSGCYAVKVTDSNGCTDISTVCISSNDSCLANAYFVIFSDSSNTGNYYGFNLSSAGTNASYIWSWGDGNISYGKYVSHTYQDTGYYDICLTVTDYANTYTCTSTYCNNVGVFKNGSGVFTINIIPTGTLGIKENRIADNNIVVAPNPFQSATNISYTINENAKVNMVVCDLMGREVAVLENDNKATGKYVARWDAANVANGVYLLQLNVNGTISTTKLVLQGQ